MDKNCLLAGRSLSRYQPRHAVLHAAAAGGKSYNCSLHVTRTSFFRPPNRKTCIGRER
jgi:hypothetical protein